MSFSVNTNNNALAALQSLNMTQQAMSKTQNHVSSGLRVAGAADDAATFAIAQGQRGDIAGFNSISNSLALGSATVNVALQGAQSISDTLNEIKAKVVQGLDPTTNAAQKGTIQNDINSLISQVQSTAAAAQFNGINLIYDGGSAGAGVAGSNSINVLSALQGVGAGETAATITVASQDLTKFGLGIGGVNINTKSTTLSFDSTSVFADNDTVALSYKDSAGATQTKTFEFIQDPTTTAPTLGSNVVVAYNPANSIGQNLSSLVTAMGQQGFSASYDGNGNLEVSSQFGMAAAATVTLATGAPTATMSTGNATNALSLVNTAISKVQSSLSSLGTVSNQLATQTNFVKQLTDTLTGGVGTLVDADLAAESANLQALQTKQQLGIQALSIANQGPGAVLTLFR